MVTNATEFAEHVENQLGWIPVDTDRQPRWKSLMIEAGKVNRRVKKNPGLYTWQNLVITVEWLVRRKLPVTPLGVFHFVDDAVQRAAADEALDAVASEIFVAITEAMVAGEPDWVERLARARGAARMDVLGQWRAHA